MDVRKNPTYEALSVRKHNSNRRLSYPVRRVRDTISFYSKRPPGCLADRKYEYPYAPKEDGRTGISEIQQSAPSLPSSTWRPRLLLPVLWILFWRQRSTPSR